MKKENPIKAIKRFKKAIEKEPDTPKFHAQLIGMLTSQGQYMECLSCIDEAIERLPHEPSFRMAKGTMFGFLNMPKCAEMYYKNADKHAIDYARMFPEDVGGHKDILNDLQEFGRDDAIAECRQIMDEYWKKQQHGGFHTSSQDQDNQSASNKEKMHLKRVHMDGIHIMSLKALKKIRNEGERRACP